MNQNAKKTRPTEATARRAMEPGANNHESPESCLDFTTPGGGDQTGIASLLMYGRENAIPGKHLRQLTGLSDRDLRRRIQEERLSGIPILSDNMSGYFLPGDDAAAAVRSEYAEPRKRDRGRRGGGGKGWC